MKSFILFVIASTLCCCQKSNFEGGDRGGSSPAAEHVAKKVADKTPVPVSEDRQLIKNGSLSIAVEDVSHTRKEIENICKGYNGYISSETQNNFPERMQYDQVIRVPAVHFDELVQKVELMSTKFDSKNIQTTDVTEEFIDNEARIKTKKEFEYRYREILRQASAISDILSIEAQLNNVRSDIESMEGRQNYLRNQVAYSTLNLSFFLTTGTTYGFGHKIASSFKNGWDMLLVFLVGLMNLWPFIIILSVGLYFLMRRTPRPKARHIKSGAENED
jgi:hypothetical protein